MIEHGQPVSYLVDENDGTIDWTAGDTIDWEDMLPNEYKMYKALLLTLSRPIPSTTFTPNEETLLHLGSICPD